MSDTEEGDVERDFDDFYEPSFVLVAIDTHPSMFVKINDEDSTTFEICLRTCYEIADSLLLKHNRRNWSPFAIILANNDDDKSILIDFNTNMIDIVHKLKEINQQKLGDLIEKYQRKDLNNFDLSRFFLACKKKFKDIKTTSYEKILLYLTNDDNPIGDNRNYRYTAINEAKNFAPNDIDFELITMKNDFDYSLFYNELLAQIATTTGRDCIKERTIANEDGMFEKLTETIILRFYQRRLQFYIDKNDIKRYLNVIQKNYVSTTKLLSNYYTTTTGRPVKKLTTSDVQDEEFVLNYNGNQIEFTLNEYLEITRTNLPIGYTLIYVTQRITDPGFVLSDPMVLESDPKDELPFFQQFWRYCIDKNTVLVCVRKLRKNDEIRFVELIPKCCNDRPAFLIKLIPYANEIEYPPEDPDDSDTSNIDGNQDEVRCINDLIDSLTCDYQPEMFQCMSYVKEENYIKSKLLDVDENDDELNDIVINKEVINERIATIVDRFNQVFKINETPVEKKKSSATGRKANVCTKKTKK